MLFEVTFHHSWFVVSGSVPARQVICLFVCCFNIAFPFTWKCRISANRFLSVDTECFQPFYTIVPCSFTDLARLFFVSCDITYAHTNLDLMTLLCSPLIALALRECAYQMFRWVWHIFKKKTKLYYTNKLASDALRLMSDLVSFVQFWRKKC